MTFDCWIKDYTLRMLLQDTNTVEIPVHTEANPEMIFRFQFRSYCTLSTSPRVQIEMGPEAPDRFPPAGCPPGGSGLQSSATRRAAHVTSIAGDLSRRSHDLVPGAFFPEADALAYDFIRIVFTAKLAC